jgi:GTP-binding protein
LDIDNSVDDFLHHLKRGDQIIVNAFTKIDKLKQNDLAKLKRDNPDGIFISNLKKRGMQDLERVISDFIFKGIVRD